MSDIRFRFAVDSDAPRLSEIYGYYVENTAVSFECVPPKADEFSRRIAAAIPQYPFIVSVLDGKVVGYAYAHSYRSFEAYRWGAELSIYVDNAYHGLGLGKALYSALIELLKMMNFQTVYGIVASPNPESERLHNSMGFRYSGMLKKAGFKLGKWYDIINYELAIGDYPKQLTDTVLLTALDSDKVENIFRKCSEMVK